MERTALRALLYGKWLELPLGGYLCEFENYYCEYKRGGGMRVESSGDCRHVESADHAEVFNASISVYVFDRIFERLHASDDIIVSPFGYSPEYCVHGHATKHTACWLDQQASAYFMPFYTAIEFGELSINSDRKIGCMDFYVIADRGVLERVNHQVFLPSDRQLLSVVAGLFAWVCETDPLGWGSKKPKMTISEPIMTGI